jgi:hypothetical protein
MVLPYLSMFLLVSAAALKLVLELIVSQSILAMSSAFRLVLAWVLCRNIAL